MYLRACSVICNGSCLDERGLTVLRVCNVIEQLLERTASLIGRAKHCWLITLSHTRRINARPMGCITSECVGTDWTLSFLADARTRKIRDIHFASDVRIIFECNEDEFASVAGPAAVISNLEVIEQRWRPSYDAYFPTVADRREAQFIDVRTQEMQLWIRGLTPEPFGSESLSLYRPLAGTWCLRTASVPTANAGHPTENE
jgi:general stress protein 26